MASPLTVAIAISEGGKCHMLLVVVVVVLHLCTETAVEFAQAVRPLSAGRDLLVCLAGLQGAAVRLLDCAQPVAMRQSDEIRGSSGCACAGSVHFESLAHAATFICCSFTW